jgi:hypothetical protein
MSSKPPRPKTPIRPRLNQSQTEKNKLNQLNKLIENSKNRKNILGNLTVRLGSIKNELIKLTSRDKMNPKMIQDRLQEIFKNENSLSAETKGLLTEIKGSTNSKVIKEKLKTLRIKFKGGTKRRRKYL